MEDKSILEGWECLHSLGDLHFRRGGDNLSGNLIRSEKSDL